MSDRHIVILAAGKGTRMKSARPKVLHAVAGRPMIDYVLKAASAVHPASTTIVVGHQAETLQGALAQHSGLSFVVQEPQLGTGHALLMAEPALAGATGTLLLLSGDVPLLKAETLGSLVDGHISAGSAMTVLTAHVANPHGYGRIVRGGSNGREIARIVEEKDASDGERHIREINSGIYAFQLDGLFEAVRTIGSGNAQREYYLPDLVAIYRAGGRRVETQTVAHPEEIQGINSRVELAAVSGIVRQAKNQSLMAAGVTIDDPATTYVESEVSIGPDTILHPGVSLEGRTTVGEGCEIHSGARLVNARLGDRVKVLNHSIITDSEVGSDASVGPFAHLRNEAVVGRGAKVGNFVEMKKTALGSESKAMHLAYLGDAVIGEKVNIGAGTITCNYDGVTKQTTRIDDGAFIGSDTQLIAPVTVGKGAYVAAGSSITENVPAGSLAISRGKQINKEGWVDRKKS